MAHPTRLASALALAITLLGCPPAGDVPTLAGEALEPLQLTIDAPLYGAFLGDGPAMVEGSVLPAGAALWVEGVRIEADADGRFVAKVPLDHAYRIVDVEAASHGDRTRIRIPVFRGRPPAETYPGGLSARLLPEGLAGVGELLGELVDAAGWADAIGAALPSFDADWIEVSPTGVEHAPTEVLLAPAEGAVALTATLVDVSLGYALVITLGNTSFEVPMGVGFGAIRIDALAAPAIDDAGVVSMVLSDTTIALDEADLEIGPLEGWILEWIVDQLNDWVIEPLGALLLDWVLAEYGTFEIGGPLAFETDLMGTTIGAALSALDADLDGLAAILAVAVDEPLPTAPPELPVPGSDDAPDGEAAVALHEGLFDQLLSDELLGMLDQDIELGGALGDIIGAAVTNLPGGEDAPEADGWCLSVWPGNAHVVRLQTGTDPLAVLYVPDLKIDVGIDEGAGCTTWLYASVALEVGIVVTDGTRITVDMAMPEGAVLDYDAAPGWDEAAVVAGLAELLESMLSLLGGTFEFDLADLFGSLGGDDPLGGVLSALQPAIVDSTPMLGEDGEPWEGLHVVTLQLFDGSRGSEDGER